MQPQDFGPIYTETNMARFPVEPLNTLSNLAFLLLVIYWIKRTRFDHRRHPLFVVTLPILFIGFIGGTMFHATRSNRIWLIMDFMPIFILGIFGAYYFWRELFERSFEWRGKFMRSSVSAGMAVLIFFALSSFLRSSVPVPRQISISLGYTSLAASILVPAFVLGVRFFPRLVPLLIKGSFLFLVAVLFRISDSLSSEYIPIGTHFLWHLCGAGACHQLFKCLFLLEEDRAPQRS